MTKTLLTNALLAALPAAVLPLTAWAQTPAPVIDNARVTVRDVPLEPGKPAPAIAHAGDYIILYRTGGRIQGSNGRVARHADGSAVWGHGGTTSDTAVGAPAYEIIVEIKDAASNTVPNTTGLPPAFPRPGSKKVFENGKVRVWNYAWVPGQPTAMHFHDTEVVVTYLQDGDVAFNINYC
ncbi:MAG: hypothetical protein H0U98_16895 [Alphaproteobacteria bacterium]|nr:hypothetical protein [Alphaproteobacteria bacterium]